MSMRGLVAVVTGGNTGIGLATANEFASRGARVIIGCRDILKGQEAADGIKLRTKNEVVVHHLDLTDFKSIESFSKSFEKCHILVNNAGAMFPEKATKCGIELTSLTNHLGHFYLSQLMLPILRKTADDENIEARIVFVASRLEKNAYSNKFPDSKDIGWLADGPEPYTLWAAYANSKLSNLLVTFEMARREELLMEEKNKIKTSENVIDGTLKSPLCQSKVTVNAVTPGMVNTELSRFAPWWQLVLSYPLRAMMLKSPQEGASTVVYAATSSEINGITGRYFGDMKMIDPSPAALSEELAGRVWEESDKQTRRIVSEYEQNIN